MNLVPLQKKKKIKSPSPVVVRRMTPRTQHIYEKQELELEKRHELGNEPHRISIHSKVYTEA